jgi:hypothetical protein
VWDEKRVIFGFADINEQTGRSKPRGGEKGNKDVLKTCKI